VRLVDDQEVVVPPAPPELTAAELETASRLFRGLGPERAEELVRFLEGAGADDFTIARDGDARPVPAASLRRRAAV
jgi:hypothetical protein